ncbi:MAG: hypothetical protein PW788_02765 [Micavibrio sp.]|nr:hypothetical protein [Micavibrio sp.]
MIDNNKELSAQELLEQRVTTAFLEQDFGGLEAILRAEPGIDELYRGRVLSTAVTANALNVVQYIFENAPVEMSPESGMLLLLEAAKAKNAALAVYLAERNFDNGVVRSDSYNIIFEHFPDDKHAKLAADIVAVSADKQDAADKILQSAVGSKKFIALGSAIDLGADVNINGDATLQTLIISKPPAAFAEKESYLALVEKFLDAGYKGGLILDLSLIITAHMSMGGIQYPETIDILLKHGADPWYNARAAETFLAEKLAEKNDREKTEALQQKFADARAAYTANAQHVFTTLFKDDFRLEDLRQYSGDRGDNGFILAARAQVLDKVMDAARNNGGLAAQDLTRRNDEKRSLLSFAIDRGDQDQLLETAYWAPNAQKLLTTLQENLSDVERAAVDLDRLTANFDQQKLRSAAKRYKLSPG